MDHSHSKRISCWCSALILWPWNIWNGHEINVTIINKKVIKTLLNTLSISNSLAGSFYSKRPWMCHLTVCPLGAFFFFSALSFSSISMFSFSIREMRVLQRLWSSCNTKQPRDPWARPHKKTDQWHCPPFFDLWPNFLPYRLIPDQCWVGLLSTEMTAVNCLLSTEMSWQLTATSYH